MESVVARRNEAKGKDRGKRQESGSETDWISKERG